MICHKDGCQLKTENMQSKGIYIYRVKTKASHHEHTFLYDELLVRNTIKKNLFLMINTYGHKHMENPTTHTCAWGSISYFQMCNILQQFFHLTLESLIFLEWGFLVPTSNQLPISRSEITCAIIIKNTTDRQPNVWWNCHLTLFHRMSIFNRHTKNDLTVVCQHMIDKFFVAFPWSFVNHMSLLAAVALARHYWMLYQASAAIWHT
jgi:hypothetical protein